MGNLLLNFINYYWTKEEVVLYTEIMDVITSVREDYADNLEYIIQGMNDDDNVDDVTVRLQDTIQYMLIDLLREIGVFVNDDYPLKNETLFNIYKEMISIEENEQIDFALSILESDRDDVTVFYELLNIVGTLRIDEFEFNNHIGKILPQTKEKLINYLRKLKSSQKPDEHKVDIQDISKKVKMFIRVLNDSEFFVINLIRNGVSLGLPFKSYMSLYGPDLFELDLKEQCYNLYLFALISSDGTDKPAELIEEEINNYVFDMGSVDTIIRAVREVQIKTRV